MIYSKQNEVLCTDCKNDTCFIQTCSRKWQQYANEHVVIQFFQKEHQIVTEGSVIAGLYFIAYGKVKIATSWGTGKNKILRFSKSGDIIGHRGFGTSYQYYIISATAKAETKTCFFETKVLYNLMQNNAQLAVCLMKFYANDLMKADIRMNLIAQKSVRERMAFALLELYDAFGKNEKGSVNLGIKISRQEMADYVGTTSENVSKFLNEFATDGGIAINGQDIELLNVEHLHKVSNLNGYKVLFDRPHQR